MIRARLMSADDHLSEPQFMYHGTNPAKRDSISKHGLLTSYSLDDPEYSVPGLYMTERPGNDHDQDVWRINTSGYRPEVDSSSGEDRSVVGESYWVSHDIPPERLSLHFRGKR